MLDRLHDGRDQVGATVDRFSQNHIRRFRLLKTADGREQIIELTTEASSGDFFDVEASLPQCVGVYKIRRLIIGHNPDSKPFLNITARQTTEGRRFAAPRKPPTIKKRILLIESPFLILGETVEKCSVIFFGMM